MNVLVVDDDVALCGLLSRYLEKNGVHVYSAPDALQALEVLDREPIELVITDLMMPHMDGIQFTEKLKAHPRHKDVPVILMTAYPDEELFERGLRRGAAITLPKPLDFNRLLSLVRFAQ